MRIPFLSPRRPTVSVIRLQGAIGVAARTGGGTGLSDAGLAPLLSRIKIMGSIDIAEKRRPLRASAGRPVTQLWYARQGVVTPEMEFIATA